ncbi:MAG: hypothetical protein ACI4S2_12530 [Lachnospiraceae bacterium]
MEIRIKPEMMGEALGIPVQAVRVGIQQGKLKFGVAYKQKIEGQRHTYVIYPEEARQTLGDERYEKMIAKAAAEDKQLKTV